MFFVKYIDKHALKLIYPKPTTAKHIMLFKLTPVSFKSRNKTFCVCFKRAPLRIQKFDPDFPSPLHVHDDADASFSPFVYKSISVKKVFLLEKVEKQKLFIHNRFEKAALAPQIQVQKLRKCGVHMLNIYALDNYLN